MEPTCAMLPQLRGRSSHMRCTLRGNVLWANYSLKFLQLRQPRSHITLRNQVSPLRLILWKNLDMHPINARTREATQVNERIRRAPTKQPLKVDRVKWEQFSCTRMILPIRHNNHVKRGRGSRVLTLVKRQVKNDLVLNILQKFKKFAP
jgi:hypothetical protein